MYVKRKISLPLLEVFGVLTCSTLAKLAESKLLKNKKSLHVMFSVAIMQQKLHPLRHRLAKRETSHSYDTVKILLITHK